MLISRLMIHPSRGRLVLCSALLVVSTALVRAQAPPSGPPADLDAYVARSMKTFEVPGLALTVVKDGKAVVAKGYGVKRLGEAAPVDAKTLFGIASNTKV